MDSCLMTFADMRFFYLPLSMMKCNRVPFTKNCEWKRRYPSFGSSSSLGWSLVVAMVELGSVSMIHLPHSSSNSESDSTYDLEDFTSATNDCFERQSTVLYQGLLWKSHHFSVSFLVLPVSFSYGLDWLS
jgi:hypothetical protein